MKTVRSLFVLVSIVYSTWAFSLSNHERPGTEAINVDFPFLLNRGQVDSSILYYTKMPKGIVYVAKNGIIHYHISKKNRWFADFSEIFAGARKNHITGKDTSRTVFNYFKGRNSSLWQRNIPGFNLLEIQNVYPGIDLSLRASTIEKVFTVKPGADPMDIQIQIQGAKSLCVNERGELLAFTQSDTIKFTRPVAWQNGRRVDVEYRIDNNTYSFNIGEYDLEKILVIDPLIAFTFLGGSDIDACMDFALDAENHVYIAGATQSLDFPVPDGLANKDPGTFMDAFVARMSENLSELEICTFIGSSSNDQANSIFLDRSGWVYVGGTIFRSYLDMQQYDFPTTFNAFDNHAENWEVFITKFNPSLSQISASTFLGGSGGDSLSMMLFDESNSTIYISGETFSWSPFSYDNFEPFPITPGAYDVDL